MTELPPFFFLLWVRDLQTDFPLFYFLSWAWTSWLLCFFYFFIFLGLARREYFFKHFFDMIFLFLINLGDFFFLVVLPPFCFNCASFFSTRAYSNFYKFIISVGPNNLWPWPIFTLGPKARAEEGYSRGWVIKVQIVLRYSRE